MDNALKNLFAVTDLRNRVLFTLAMLGVYRVGSHIPTPGVNRRRWRSRRAGGEHDVRSLQHVHRAATWRG